MNLLEIKKRCVDLNFIQMTLIILLIIIISPSYTHAASFSSSHICLMKPNLHTPTIQCGNKQERLFITEQRYTSDIYGHCGEPKTLNKTECYGYTQTLIESCNGKSDCNITIDRPVFNFGFQGANCDFKADILTVSYECIPVEYNDKSIPSYDICNSKSIEHPVHGYLHSPHFPNSYRSNLFCQLTVNIDIKVQRLEVYLLDMELEGLSKRKHVPTDFLQINNREVIFGSKRMRVIFNSTEDAVFKFKSDTWFNYRGFILYFKGNDFHKFELKKNVLIKL